MALQSSSEITQSHNITIRGKKDMDKYPAKAHAHRIAEELQVHDGLIVLSATKSSDLPNSDMPAPFRQDRYFYYLTGCNEPNCHVVYDIKNDKLTLWLPPVDKDWRHVVFYGNGSTTEEAQEKYDIDEAQYLQDFNGPVASDLEKFGEEPVDSIDRSGMRDIWTTLKSLGLCCHYGSGQGHADQKQTCLFSFHAEFLLSGPRHWQKYDKLSLIGASSTLKQAIDTCRVIKDQYEIERIRRANEITAEAHTSVLRGMHTFDNEAQVDAAYMQVCIARRAKAQAYDPIVGSGPNATVLHYSENLANFGEGQTIVLDAGCEVECYASDVTRTIPINRRNAGTWPSKEAEDIYLLVEKIQESCIRQMLPGNKFLNTTWHAHEMVIEGLRRLGILKGDLQEIFHAGVSTAFLPHGLGHHVGLEVHDVSPVPHPPLVSAEEEHIQRFRKSYAEYKPYAASHVQRLSKAEHFSLHSWGHGTVESVDAPVLEPGMVVTVEPGIYFNAFVLERFLKDPQKSKFVDRKVLQRYIPVGGVRIEDDILITKHGYENLTTAPKGEAMLKVIQEASKVRQLEASQF
ncbi:Xaa-Pro aminopeptidase [Lecanosticta acicola]|uniref:Xaa-Pro aminopeptidase n=1 Tax=Lecanosticta acicola TaxID=111012 RepID=A0AAI8YTQ5_9PEZI|nr:Xaa-Pro aminopeptidase [Lecanosticta acicola]